MSGPNQSRLDGSEPTDRLDAFSGGDPDSACAASALLAASSDDDENGLCDALETIADALPSICALRYVKLVGDLRRWREAGRVERLEAAFDALAPAQQRPLRHALSRLIIEERADSDTALELIEAMMSAVREREANAEALGYLLRCFFESRRRHIDWRRRAFLEPIAQARNWSLVVSLLPETPEHRAQSSRPPRRQGD